MLLGGTTLDVLFDAQLALDLVGRGQQIGRIDVGLDGDDYFFDHDIGFDTATSTTGTARLVNGTMSAPGEISRLGPPP